MKQFRYIILALFLGACNNSRIPINEIPEHMSSNPEGKGNSIALTFIRGEGHNHPSMAIWVEDTSGNFLQTLYISQSIAKGVFRHGDSSEGIWKPGEIQRPASLPRWAHQRGIQNEYGTYMPTPALQVPDAYTGPTPGISFILNTRLDQPAEGPIKIFLEINQTWDWNWYWTNNKFPDDKEYISSCQPAIVYEVLVDPSLTGKEYRMLVIGRSHHSGATGELFTDLETLTSSLHIAKDITVRLPE